MTYTLRETITVAEMAVAGDSGTDGDELSQMVIDLGHAKPGEEQDRAYLAVLLNSLDLREEALITLEPSDDENLGDDDVDIAVLRNFQGVLLASNGQYGRALELLEVALSATQVGTLQRTRILANLAGVCLRYGRATKAGSWVAEARDARDQAGDTAVDVLLASVEAGIARTRGDRIMLTEATSALAEASRSRIAEVGHNHPQALTAVANLAAMEFERTRAESSLQSREQALEVLEIISERLAAELGADNPQTLISMANFVMAELMMAFEDESTQDLRLIVDSLGQISRRIDSVLGGGHPQALTVSQNLALAVYAQRMMTSILSDPEIADVIETGLAIDAPRTLPRSLYEGLEPEPTMPSTSNIRKSSPFYDKLVSIRTDPKVFRYALGLAGDHDLAEDALNQTFLAIARVKNGGQIHDLQAYFNTVLRRELYKLRGQLGAVLAEDFDVLQERHRVTSPETPMPADEIAPVLVMASIWMTRLVRNRARLLAGAPSRSPNPDRYRESIVAAAEKIFRAALQEVISSDDFDAALLAAYPEWFGEPGIAENALHQRFARARADIRAILRKVVAREEL